MVRVLDVSSLQDAPLYGWKGSDYVFYLFPRNKIWLVPGFFPLPNLGTLIITLCGGGLSLYGRANRPIRAPESPVSQEVFCLSGNHAAASSGLFWEIQGYASSLRYRQSLPVVAPPTWWTYARVM